MRIKHFVNGSRKVHVSDFEQTGDFTAVVIGTNPETDKYVVFSETTGHRYMIDPLKCHNVEACEELGCFN